MVHGRENGGPKATTGSIVFAESPQSIRDKSHPSHVHYANLPGNPAKLRLFGGLFTSSGEDERDTTQQLATGVWSRVADATVAPDRGGRKRDERFRHTGKTEPNPSEWQMRNTFPIWYNDEVIAPPESKQPQLGTQPPKILEWSSHNGFPSRPPSVREFHDADRQKLVLMSLRCRHGRCSAPGIC